MKPSLVGAVTQEGFGPGAQSTKEESSYFRWEIREGFLEEVVVYLWEVHLSLYVWANSCLIVGIQKWMLGMAHHLLHHLGQLNPPRPTRDYTSRPCDFSDCLLHSQIFVYIQCGLCPGWWDPSWVIPACFVKPGINRRVWCSRQSSPSAHLTVLHAKNPCLGWGVWPWVHLPSPISSGENHWRMTLFWTVQLGRLYQGTHSQVSTN